MAGTGGAGSAAAPGSPWETRGWGRPRSPLLRPWGLRPCWNPDVVPPKSGRHHDLLPACQFLARHPPPSQQGLVTCGPASFPCAPLPSRCLRNRILQALCLSRVPPSWGLAPQPFSRPLLAGPPHPVLPQTPLGSCRAPLSGASCFPVHFPDPGPWPPWIPSRCPGLYRTRPLAVPRLSGQRGSCPPVRPSPALFRPSVPSATSPPSPPAIRSLCWRADGGSTPCLRSFCPSGYGV